MRDILPAGRCMFDDRGTFIIRNAGIKAGVEQAGRGRGREAEREELVKLRRENQRLRLEHEILKIHTGRTNSRSHSLRFHYYFPLLI